MPNGKVLWELGWDRVDPILELLCFEDSGLRACKHGPLPAVSFGENLLKRASPLNVAAAGGMAAFDLQYLSDLSQVPQVGLMSFLWLLGHRNVLAQWI